MSNKICVNHPRHGEIGNVTVDSAKVTRTRDIRPPARFFNDDYENGSNDENSHQSDDSSDKEVQRERLEHLDPILQERNEVANEELDGIGCFADRNWEYYEPMEHVLSPPKTRNGPPVDDNPICLGIDFKGHAQNIPIGTESAGEFMDLLFTEAILQRFVTNNSNSFAMNQTNYNADKFVPFVIDDLRKYFAILLYMGIVERPDMKSYWQLDEFGDVFVRRIMPRRRFMEIQSNLHWTDASDVSEQERKNKNRADGFWTVKEFLEILSANFQLYHIVQLG